MSFGWVATLWRPLGAFACGQAPTAFVGGSDVGASLLANRAMALP